MLILNLFRNIKMTCFERVEPHQIRSWTELLIQLIRIVTEYNDWDPARVPNLPEFETN